jgi:hypothetical protein
MMSGTNDSWFKPKRYGYGNSPSGWKGWAITIAFVLFVAAVIEAAKMGVLPPILCALIALLATLAFVLFSKAKTSGEWRWRWGSDN